MNRCLLRTSIALAIACCVCLTGCGGSSPMSIDNFNKIQEGMTIEQVGEIMGFKPPDLNKTSIIPGADIMDTQNGIDRQHKPTNLDGLAYDEFHYKELGGQNKKAIYVTYQDNKVTQKSEVGLQ